VTPLVALSIAGSDSGGGAGIQADLKTFSVLGVFGTTAVTALTAQNTVKVSGIVPIDPSFVVDQVRAVLDDLSPAAVKTGMLAAPETVRSVAELASRGALPNLVVDPVLVSSTGYTLMEEGGVDAYLRLLIPLAKVVTPNLRETALLTGRTLADLSSTASMIEAAEELRSLGPEMVVVKGGHLSEGGNDDASSPDVVSGPSGTLVLEGERISTVNDHGTGCSFSAAVAALLALGEDPLSAVRGSKELVSRALSGAAGWQLGIGRGPIDHFGWSDGGSDGPSEEGSK